MTWRVPKWIPTASQVVDYRDMNDAFQEFVDADGHLSEGNFNTGMSANLNQVSDIADDAVFRATRQKAVAYAGGPFSAATNYVTIKPGPGWQVVSAGGSGELVDTIDVTTGPIIVLASFQHRRKVPNDSSDNVLSTTFLHTRYAIQVDGNVIEHTVTGDQDWATAGEGMERGIWNHLQGVELFAVIPVAPGRHTVKVVAQCILQSALPVTPNDAALVFNRELIVVEAK